MDAQLARLWSVFTTGIYILTTRAGGRGHGMSASWVTQVSGNPPLLMVAVGRGGYSHSWISRDRLFGLNVGGQRSKALQDHFHSAAAKRPHNLDGVQWFWSPAGVPWLTAALVCVECRVVDCCEVGDRTAFISAISASRWGRPDQPLTSLDLPYVYVGELYAHPWRRSVRNQGNMLP